MAGLNMFAEMAGGRRPTAPGTAGPELAFGGNKQATAMFKTLRRLHGHNLENQGLNDLSEAFQAFVTRAKFFSVGRLRRTWSHSAVEFIKYRRLLPMLVADEHHPGSVFDDFDTSPTTFAPRASSRASKAEGRKVTVANVSPRVTAAQLQAFMSKFGAVTSCKMASDDRRLSTYSTLPKKHSNKPQLAHVIFADEDSAHHAIGASHDDLKFYGQVMTVQMCMSFAGRRRTFSTTSQDQPSSSGFSVFVAGGPEDQRSVSRSSSIVSVSSTGTTSSSAPTFPFDELPTKVLERVLAYLPAVDRIRFERVSKRYLEVSVGAWKHVNRLSIRGDPTLRSRFSVNNPLKNPHLKALLMRGGSYLKSLDISSTVNLLNDRAVIDIANLCSQLVELDISGVHASATALQTLSESLQHLTRLSYRDMATAGDKAFWYLFKNCGKKLKFVDLRGCKRIKGRCFKLCGMALEEVYLDGCPRIDGETIDDICLLSGNVRVLRLNGCSRLSEFVIASIARHLNELRELALGGDRFPKLSSEAIMPITRHVGMEVLELDHNPLLNDDLLKAITSGMPNLTKLTMAFAGTDATLTQASLLTITNLELLQELNLSGIAAVNGPVIEKITESCKELSVITLQSCTYLSDAGIASLAKLKVVSHIDLSGCILIHSQAVQELVKAFKPDAGLPTVTIVVGGTVCENQLIRIRNTRAVIDWNDYSSDGLNTYRRFFESEPKTLSDDSDNDEDVFELLETQRSFAVNALNTADDDTDVPYGDEQKLRAWAEREAAHLGLTVPQNN